MSTRHLFAAAALALSLAVGVAFAVPTPDSHNKEAMQAADGTYAVDPTHTTVMFKIKHLNTSWFYGRFADVSGKVMHNAAEPEKSSVEFEVKTASVDTFNEGRNKHVRSADFFDAAQFPTATFKSKKIAKGGRGLTVTGDLTLHGVTKEITIDASAVGSGKDMQGGAIAGFDGSFTFKRSDFGMKQLLEAVGDDVTILVSIEAAKK